MLEDALKLTRNIHRLIISLTGIIFVFALSISIPEEKLRQLSAFEKLITTDFTIYSEFVDGRVADFIGENPATLADDIERVISSSDVMLINSFELSNKFREPIHIGRVAVEDTFLSDMRNAKLSSIEALNVLDLHRNAEVIFPKSSLLEKIEYFFEDKDGLKRLSDINININSITANTNSSVFSEKHFTFELSFQLFSTAHNRSPLNFKESIEYNVIEIPDTSFLYWLENHEAMESIIEVHGDQIRTGSDLTDLPFGERETPLSEMVNQLTRQIAQLGPDQQTATFLGTTVPGRLVLIAAPIVMIALQYYFTQHTKHLAQMASEYRNEFREFAWLPLKGYRDHSRIWWVEPAATVILLPLFSLFALLFQLKKFGDISLLPLIIVNLTALSLYFFGFQSLRNIYRIRSEMREKEYIMNKSSEDNY